MDEQAKAAARGRSGVVTRSDLGTQAVRDAPGQGLVEVQPGAFLAVTQPYDLQAQLASVLVSHPDLSWWLLGESALWRYGYVEAPERLEVGIGLRSDLAIRPPIRLRRVSPSVLLGNRVLDGVPLVALEAALVHWAHRRPADEVLRLVEKVLRDRRTTIPRLRARLRRGVGGSAALRAAVDQLMGGSLDRDVRVLKAALEALGVTGLECEVRFTSAAGASAYADLLHRPTMTVIEVDGLLDHLVGTRFLADRRRDRWLLREHGSRTLRVDVREVRGDLARTAAELAGFLVRPAA